MTIVDEEDLIGFTIALKAFCNMVENMDNIMIKINGTLLRNCAIKNLWFFLKSFSCKSKKKRKL